MTDNKINKNLGLYCLAGASALYVFYVLKIVMSLPVKIDTLLLLSWPTLPGVIGSYIFYKMDKNGSWKNSQ